VNDIVYVLELYTVDSIFVWGPIEDRLRRGEVI